MLTGLPRASFVMAASYCICSVLPYSAIEDLVDMHPEAFTTLVQTMVRMYSLKPEWSWKDLTLKLAKKFGIHNDLDAFVWFRSHLDAAEGDDLNAKAFDMACRRLNMPHLDRRIFWSQLDKDASGGIDYEEFKGKLKFGDPDDAVAEEATESGTDLRRPDDRSSAMSLSMSPPMIPPSSETMAVSFKQRTRSLDDGVPRVSYARDPSESSSQATPLGLHTDKSFTLLLEQNQHLLQEIHRLHFSPT